MVTRARSLLLKSNLLIILILSYPIVTSTRTSFVRSTWWETSDRTSTAMRRPTVNASFLFENWAPIIHRQTDRIIFILLIEIMYLLWSFSMIKFCREYIYNQHSAVCLAGLLSQLSVQERSITQKIRDNLISGPIEEISVLGQQIQHCNIQAGQEEQRNLIKTQNSPHLLHLVPW